MTAEDVPHDAHVVLNVVHGESVHAQELGEQGLPVSLHNVRVILLRQILNQLSWIYSMCNVHQYGQFEIGWSKDRIGHYSYFSTILRPVSEDDAFPQSLLWSSF